MENPPNTVPQKSNSLRNGFLLILALILIGLLYLKVVYNDKTATQSSTATENIGFNDLPKGIQEQYKAKDEYKKLEEKFTQLLEEKQALATKLLLLQQTKKDTTPISNVNTPIIEKKVDSVIAQKETTKEEIFPKIKPNAALIKEFAKCYDMEKGSYSSTVLCKNNLIEFINKHKNASYFEIIGIVDETEFTLFKNLENNTSLYEQLELTQHSLDIMKNIAQVGLAQNRAMEANWLIKEHTQTKAKVYNANYNIFSKEGLRGFIIRAYK